MSADDISSLREVTRARSLLLARRLPTVYRLPAHHFHSSTRWLARLRSLSLSREISLFSLSSTFRKSADYIQCRNTFDRSSDINYFPHPERSLTFFRKLISYLENVVFQHNKYSAKTKITQIKMCLLERHLQRVGRRSHCFPCRNRQKVTRNNSISSEKSRLDVQPVNGNMLSFQLIWFCSVLLYNCDLTYEGKG